MQTTETKGLTQHTPGPRERARELYEAGMQCNCDLDNWQPEESTGHSWVCRIHKTASAKAEGR